MRARRARRFRVVGLSAAAWAVMTDEADDGSLEQFLLRNPDGAELQQLWGQYGDEIVGEWAIRRPGSRPRCWWRWDAPRQPPGRYPRAWFDGELPEPRRRLGGRGRLWSEQFTAIVTDYEMGLPGGEWIDVDPSDVPIFESQAAYLKRFNLLTADEVKHLKPADFAPEVLKIGAK